MTASTAPTSPAPCASLPDHAPPLRFVRRGELVTLHDVPPNRSLLDVLREDLGCTGTKEGCGEGDCGACTVVLAEPRSTQKPGQSKLVYRAINSCIRLAHSIDGMALWTVEDLDRSQAGFVADAPACGGCQRHDEPTGPTHDAHAAHATPDTHAHPVQQALVDHHGSQCGFCTPGFVMSMFGLYQQSQPTQPETGVGNSACPPAPISRHQAQVALSGNLCRCTGYRPILQATQNLHHYPPQWVDEARTLALLEQLKPTPGQAADFSASYLQPHSLADLLAARAALPQAQIVAGCTDVGLWINKQHRQFSQILDLSQTRELTQIEQLQGPDGRPLLSLGAAVRLTDAYATLSTYWPELRTFTQRFAGLPVRNAGTLGGNVANGSPIGDSMPLLIALGASVVLASARGTRELPLEALYTGYRRHVMAADEILAYIRLPLPSPEVSPNTLLRAYKISKRYDDDISAVCLVLHLQCQDGVVLAASIGAGGVAATPARAVQTEAALRGQPWTAATVQQAMQVLRQEFQPISDMRASGDYRRAVLGNLLWRFWLESQASPDASPINLENHQLSGEEGALA